MRTLFPEIEPFDTGTLAVDGRHTLYYEQCGNPKGKPVVLLHGGPGAGCSAKMRRFHDPANYRIILFDQRGSGRSTPHADLVDNTTWDLVADIERLRGAVEDVREQAPDFAVEDPDQLPAARHGDAEQPGLAGGDIAARGGLRAI